MTRGPNDDAFRATTCRPGESAATCSFLMYGPDGFECSKGTSMESLILARRNAGTLKSMGDNCDGPPSFNNLSRSVT